LRESWKESVCNRFGTDSKRIWAQIPRQISLKFFWSTQLSGRLYDTYLYMSYNIKRGNKNWGRWWCVFQGHFEVFSCYRKVVHIWPYNNRLAQNLRCSFLAGPYMSYKLWNGFQGRNWRLLWVSASDLNLCFSCFQMYYYWIFFTYWRS